MNAQGCGALAEHAENGHAGSVNAVFDELKREKVILREKLLEQKKEIDMVRSAKDREISMLRDKLLKLKFEMEEMRAEKDREKNEALKQVLEKQLAVRDEKDAEIQTLRVKHGEEVASLQKELDAKSAELDTVKIELMRR